jgi:hypothetical protein
LFPTDILGLEPVGFGGVLLSTPLHAYFLDLHHLLKVHIQLANKMGFKKEISHVFIAKNIQVLTITFILPVL